jgi:hypothetical protein
MNIGGWVLTLFLMSILCKMAVLIEKPPVTSANFYETVEKMLQY